MLQFDAILKDMVNMENVSFALLKETYPFKILKKCLDLSRIFKDTMLISLDFRDYNN